MCFDRVFGGPVERFDAEVLLAPFEGQLHLPSTPVEVGNREGGERKIVGEKDQGLVAFGIVVLEAPQFFGVIPTGVNSPEQNGLIAVQARLLVDGMGIKPTELKIRLASNDKEGGTLGEPIQPVEVEIAAIHDIEGAGLGEQFVEYLDLVQLALGDVVERGDVASQIEEGMEFDRRFGLSESGPRKHRETQIDGRGIEGIDGESQLQAELLVEIELAGNLDQRSSKVGIDAPIADPLGIGQGAVGHLAANSHVVELGLLGKQTGFDIAQTLAVGELGKGHAEVLFETREVLDFVVASITLDAAPECVHGQMVDYL